MTTPTYHTILAEEAGYALAEVEYDTGGPGYHVVRIDRAAGQVYDARPSDGPDDGGQWCASITAAGIFYVSGGQTRPNARRAYRQLVREAAEIATYRDGAAETGTPC